MKVTQRQGKVKIKGQETRVIVVEMETGAVALLVIEGPNRGWLLTEQGKPVRQAANQELVKIANQLWGQWLMGANQELGLQE